MNTQLERYDVEPVDTTGFRAVLLGSVALITGALAVIGWPVPAIGTRFGQDSGAWETTMALIDEWLAADEWRLSGASWLWGGIAVSATIGGVLLVRSRGPASTRTWVWSLAPGAALAITGPLAQSALGIPWSNYSGARVDAAALVVYVLVLIVVFGLLVLLGRPTGRQT